jgi:hypothetical protein
VSLRLFDWLVDVLNIVGTVIFAVSSGAISAARVMGGVIAGTCGVGVDLVSVMSSVKACFRLLERKW